MTGVESLRELDSQKPVYYSLWDDPDYTASSHTLAIPLEVLASAHIEPGDDIGIFTPEGLCAGLAEIKDMSANNCIPIVTYCA